LTGGRQQFLLYFNPKYFNPNKMPYQNVRGEQRGLNAIVADHRWLGLRALPDLPGRLAVIPEPEVDESARPF
jgi:hypothetical protein